METPELPHEWEYEMQDEKLRGPGQYGESVPFVEPGTPESRVSLLQEPPFFDMQTSTIPAAIPKKARRENGCRTCTPSIQASTVVSKTRRPQPSTASPPTATSESTAITGNEFGSESPRNPDLRAQVLRTDPELCRDLDQVILRDSFVHLVGTRARVSR